MCVCGWGVCACVVCVRECGCEGIAVIIRKLYDLVVIITSITQPIDSN